MTRRCGQDCNFRRRGLAHPPVLVVYDKGDRSYGVPDDAVCTARWATSSRQHAEGDLCGAPATEMVGDIDMCPHHYQRALEWFYRRIEEMPERVEQARRAAAEKERLIAEERSIVYFLHSEVSGLVKIGTTTAYRTRLSALQSEHGPLRLLLAVPGARPREAETHRRFHAQRAAGEWFRAERPLLLWIKRTREAQSVHKETRLPDQVPVSAIRMMLREERRARERAA